MFVFLLFLSISKGLNLTCPTDGDYSVTSCDFCNVSGLVLTGREHASSASGVLKAGLGSLAAVCAFATAFNTCC